MERNAPLLSGRAIVETVRYKACELQPSYLARQEQDALGKCEVAKLQNTRPDLRYARDRNINPQLTRGKVKEVKETSIIEPYHQTVPTYRPVKQQDENETQQPLSQACPTSIRRLQYLSRTRTEEINEAVRFVPFRFASFPTVLSYHCFGPQTRSFSARRQEPGPRVSRPVPGWVGWW